MTTKEKEIFTTEEAAEMMGCSPSTIESSIYAVLGGRTYKIRTCDQRIKRPQPPFKIKHLPNRYLLRYPTHCCLAVFSHSCPCGHGIVFKTLEEICVL